MADDFEEQRAAVKLCFLLGKTVDETRDMLRIAYEESAYAKSKIYYYFSRFRRGEMEIEYHRPSKNSEAVDKIRPVVSEDRRRSVKDLAGITGVSEDLCRRTLSQELRMEKVAGKWTPIELTTDHKFNRVAVCELVGNMLESDPDMFAKVVTGDEFLCYGSHSETGESWKTMLIAFFDSRGFLHAEFVPAGKTIWSQKFYLEVLQRAVESVKQKRPEWRQGNFYLHHENTYANNLLMQEFFSSHNISPLPHPPYSPDLAPCDFFLYPMIHKHFNERRLENLDSVKKETALALNNIPRNYFQACFEEWKTRFSRCITLNGKYVEGVVESNAKKDQQYEMENQIPAVSVKTHLHLAHKGVENNEAQSSHQQVTTRKFQQGNQENVKPARTNSVVLPAHQKCWLVPNQRTQPTFQQEAPTTIIIDDDDDDEIKVEEIKSDQSELSTMQTDPLVDSSDGLTNVEIKSELEDDLTSDLVQEIFVPVEIKCEAGFDQIMLENTAVEDIKQEPEPIKQENCSCEDNNDNFINKRHFPTSKIRSPITNKKNFVQYVQWECENCNKDNIKKITMYRCAGCPEEPGLCIECFIPWHVSEKNFRTN
uniref:Mariner Mos1 transposase n=1 Tax=Lygus hesperus TaxID=30085 RepID=A0A0A9YM19_LYGHE